MGVVEEDGDIDHVGGAEDGVDEVDEVVGQGDLSENEGVGSAEQDQVEARRGARGVSPHPQTV